MFIYTTFEIDEKVKLRTTGREGIIEEVRNEKKKNDKTGVIENFERYLVRFTEYTTSWHPEEDLRSLLVMDYDFNKKFELGLLNFMIDVSLDNRNYNHVKYLNEQRQQYLKKKA